MATTFGCRKAVQSGFSLKKHVRLFRIWAGILYLAVLSAFGIEAVLVRPGSPSSPWKQYAFPEEAGFDAARLVKVRALAESSGSTAVMVVQEGKVLAAWGDVSRRIELHSAPPRREWIEVPIDRKTLEAYVGEYVLSAGSKLVIRLYGGRLAGEMMGQEIDLFPESETRFFAKAAEVEVVFVKNDRGTVTGLSFTYGGRTEIASKSK